MRTTPTLVATALAILAAVAGGCTDGDPPAEEPTSETTSPTDSPPATDEVVRATGTVVKGVEPGCLLLDTGATRYLLLGGDRTTLEPGRRLTVTGFADLEAVTTCMEGVPLEVAEITPAG